MVDQRQALIDRVRALPEDLLDAAFCAIEDAIALHTRGCAATPEELAAIDPGLRAAERGEFATPEEVEAVLRKFRRA